MKPGINGTEFEQILVRPHFARGFSDCLLQFCKTALLREPDVVDRRGLVKVQKFIVYVVFFFTGPFRNNAGDISGDGDNTEIFHNADPLVALLHIEFVHIFIGFDGITDALIHVDAAQIRPFAGEFRILF